MFTFLNFALEDTSALWLIETSDLENLRRVEPRVGTPSHNCDALAHPIHVLEVIFRDMKRVERRLHLKDGYTTISGLEGTTDGQRQTIPNQDKHDLEYL